MDVLASKNAVWARDFLLSRLEHGHYTFTVEEAEGAIGPGEKTKKALSRLAKQGWLFSPSRGFYVIVDPQHRASGFLPIEWFIDDWMSHLGGRYYVGLLTAAMLHGASHQKPQQIQIVRDTEFRPVDKGAYQISFFYKKSIPDDCCEQRQSLAGYFRVSTPEMTAYDILRYPKACPSLDLAATVLQELGEKIRPDALAALVGSGAEVAALQRLGWLLDYTGWSGKTGLLAGRLQQKQMAWRPLRTDLPEDGSRDSTWHVVANAAIEADLWPGTTCKCEAELLSSPPNGALRCRPDRCRQDIPGGALSSLKLRGKKSPLSRRAVAYHEAGHAVADWLYGERFKRITILPSKDSAGSVLGYHMPKRLRDALEFDVLTPHMRDAVEKHVVAFLAGHLTEEMVRKRIPQWSWESDRRAAVDLLSRLCGSNEEVQAYVNWLVARANNLVSSPRFQHLVHRLAEALLEKDELGYSTSIEVLKQADADGRERVAGP